MCFKLPSGFANQAFFKEIEWKCGQQANRENGYNSVALLFESHRHKYTTWAVQGPHVASISICKEQFWILKTRTLGNRIICFCYSFFFTRVLNFLQQSFFYFCNNHKKWSFFHFSFWKILCCTNKLKEENDQHLYTLQLDSPIRASHCGPLLQSSSNSWDPEHNHGTVNMLKKFNLDLIMLSNTQSTFKSPQLS